MTIEQGKHVLALLEAVVGSRNPLVAGCLEILGVLAELDPALPALS
jgi:hypothetical protein